jgi:hypothetical protein
MAINPHHTIEEINGIRCSLIERKISSERASFIQAILESSGQEVICGTDPEGFITLGVTNLVFNLAHALYARQLRTPDKKLVTPAIWYQKPQTEGFYWEYNK